MCLRRCEQSFPCNVEKLVGPGDIVNFVAINHLVFDLDEDQRAVAKAPELDTDARIGINVDEDDYGSLRKRTKWLSFSHVEPYPPAAQSEEGVLKKKYRSDRGDALTHEPGP